MIDKDILEELILIRNMSYKDIGKMYGLSDVTIRKHAIKQGIILPKRKQTDNKYCLNCNKKLTGRRKWMNKYCCQQCQADYEHKKVINNWKEGKISATTGKSNCFKRSIKRYLLNIYNSSCQICGCNDINPYSGLSILQVHHINGDSTDNREENLQLLCPNCHAKTENFGKLNERSTRIFIH